MLMGFCSDGRRQIVFYQSGVGSEANFDGTSIADAVVLRASLLTVG
jgi:hypothetical protein